MANLWYFFPFPARQPEPSLKSFSDKKDAGYKLTLLKQGKGTAMNPIARVFATILTIVGSWCLVIAYSDIFSGHVPDWSITIGLIGSLAAAMILCWPKKFSYFDFGQLVIFFVNDGIGWRYWANVLTNMGLQSLTAIGIYYAQHHEKGVTTILLATLLVIALPMAILITVLIALPSTSGKPYNIEEPQP